MIPNDTLTTFDRFCISFFSGFFSSLYVHLKPFNSTQYFGLSHVHFFLLLFSMLWCELFFWLNKWSVAWMAWVLFVHGYNDIYFVLYGTGVGVVYPTHTHTWWVGFFCWTIKPPLLYDSIQYTHFQTPCVFFITIYRITSWVFFPLLFCFLCSFFFKALQHIYEVNLTQKSCYKSWFSYFCTYGCRYRYYGYARVCRELELSNFDIP